MARSINARADALSLDQMAALHRLVCDNSAEYQSGGKVKESSINWPSVIEQARPVMTEAQWREVQPWVLRRVAAHALEAHVRAERENKNETAAANKP